MSKKLVLNAAGDAATVTDATLADVLTTVIDPNAALTGMYKYIQTALVAGAAMAVQKKRDGLGFNIFA